MVLVIGFGVNAVSNEPPPYDVEEWSLEGMSKLSRFMVNSMEPRFQLRKPSTFQLYKLAIEQEFSSVSKVSDLRFDDMLNRGGQDLAVARFTVETKNGEVFENCICNVVEDEDSNGIFLEDCESSDVVFDAKVFIPKTKLEEAVKEDFALFMLEGLQLKPKKDQ